MPEQLLFDTAVTFGIVVGLCFLPKWLWWIIPHANSIYDALQLFYGRTKALALIGAGSAVMTAGIMLVYWGSKSG